MYLFTLRGIWRMAILSLAHLTVGNRQSTITTAHTYRATAFPNPWRQMTTNVFLPVGLSY